MHGPDAFPVVADNDGYAYIVAGKFGKGSTYLVPLISNCFLMKLWNYSKLWYLHNNLGQIHGISMGRKILGGGATSQQSEKASGQHLWVDD